MAVVANINRTNQGVELILSDGYYWLKSNLKSSSEMNGNDDRFIGLIDSKKIFVGQKLNFVN